MMDYSAAPITGAPPRLGASVPGTTGGLPAQAGLSATMNPMAKQLQSMGRGDDSMLVHMTPGEVNSLQGLAMATGGSLTINPQTGLPEAGWLGKLLPTLIGFGLNFIPGVGPLLSAGLTAAGTTAITGNLQKGLMAGLGAFGGASLAGALAPAATGTALASSAAGAAAPEVVTQAAAPVAEAASGAANAIPLTETLATAPMKLAAPAINPAFTQPGLLGRFANAAQSALPAGTPGMITKAAPVAAGLGLLSGVSGAMTSSGIKTKDGAIDNSYQGPYTAQKREATFAPSTADILASSKERDYFNVDQPEIYNTMGQVTMPGSETAPGTPIVRSVLNPTAKKGQPMYSFTTMPYMTDQDEGYAEGGEVDMKDGAFVVDARTVSELGNGSSNAGIEALARMGGRPLHGPGDGVSDSIPARIGGKQEARVARDEVVFSPEAVKRIGKGSEARGTAKLYALMDKAHKARKSAKRGEDTGLRKGLA